VIVAIVVATHFPISFTESRDIIIYFHHNNAILYIVSSQYHLVLLISLMAFSSLHWKAVDVSLPDDSHDAEDNKNHYDDEKLSKKAKKDLEADPGEDVAMFYGLEVIDGSHYQIIGNGASKRVIFRDDDPPKDSVSDSTGTKKQTKDRKARLLDQESPGDQQHEESEDKKPAFKGPVHQEAEPMKMKSRKQDRNDTEAALVDDDAGTSKSTNPKKKKKKKEAQQEEPVNDSAVDAAQVSALQDSWITSTGGVVLKDSICEGLLKQGFQSPTPIQAATLAASILGRRNVVGAAATGSGKTLAYLLPILQDLKDQQELQALILTPTRELALQVTQECIKLAPKSCGTLVGGLALAKQARVLSQRPPILVATAGRLWELVSSIDVLNRIIPSMKTKFADYA
jgi:primosomal protein N'